MMRQKVTVVGIGYVGLGIGTMLSMAHDVIMLDVDRRKVDLINERKSPIKEDLIDEYLKKKQYASIRATMDKEEAYRGADFVLVAVPTNYDEDSKKFDTTLVDGVVRDALTINPSVCVVIKSTVPVGYTKDLRTRLLKEGFGQANIIFSPEFLREGSALKDNLYPSRVIVGCDTADKVQYALAGKFLQMIRSTTHGNYQEMIMGSTEAEAVKLFANTYLAMRVAYFNELDTYAECNGLNVKEIVEGMCYDPRIGNQYNNPSFGYGGYCFPKDTKQLLANFEGVPQNLIGAIVESNETRKRHIADMVGQGGSVGVYRLAMKSGSDNFRKSAIIDVIRMLKERDCRVYIYEPEINEKEFNGCEVVRDLEEFKEKSHTIITNRYDSKLDDVKGRVYTRDIFHNN